VLASCIYQPNMAYEFDEAGLKQNIVISAVVVV
jgi:hypothetical protein